VSTPWSNWAGTAKAAATRVARPASTDELASELRKAAEDGLRVKAVGAGHSFTPAALTSGLRVELDQLASPVRVDTTTRRVTVQAGMRLHDLNLLLAAHGLALPNLGDIDVQTVAGALATGTHGTGAGFGCLSTFIAGLDLVTASGDVVSCAPGTELFDAARVNVGALGVVSAVTLQCV